MVTPLVTGIWRTLLFLHFFDPPPGSPVKRKVETVSSLFLTPHNIGYHSYIFLISFCWCFFDLLSGTSVGFSPLLSSPSLIRFLRCPDFPRTAAAGAPRGSVVVTADGLSLSHPKFADRRYSPFEGIPTSFFSFSSVLNSPFF